jgi:hypothetical protein
MYLSGGNTLFAGFKDRLAEELMNLMAASSYPNPNLVFPSAGGKIIGPKIIIMPI